MNSPDLDLTQAIQAPEDTEDQNADNNIHAVLKVEVDASPPKVLSYTVKPGSNLIGRSHECDIVISNKLVSKQHARLELDRNGITIMDLGSQNKTKIGKRVLKPRVYFNLDYNDTFFLAGIPARVMRDNDNGVGDDADSDTCSESLLTAAEVSEDQAGVAEPVVHSNSSTADCNSERVEGEVEHPVSSSAAGENQIVKPSSQNDSKPPSSHESRSSGSFHLPEMPSLEYTQSDSSLPAEPHAEDESCRNNRAAGASQDSLKPAADNPPVGDSAKACDAVAPKDAEATAELQEDNVEAAKKENHLTAETQPYADVDEFAERACTRQDGLPGDIADEADRLNAPTQPYNTQYSEVTFVRPDGLPGDEADEIDRLNAPTQPYNTQYETTCVREDGLPGDEANEADRLNAPTQPYVDDAQGTEAAALLSGADADEDDRFVAPTQGFNDEEEQGESCNAPALTSAADDEQERLNAVTQSFHDDDAELSDHGENEGMNNSTLTGDKRRLLLSADLSFVLCEATQPDKEEEEDDYYCPPTQKDTSPNLKVHALLKSRKARREQANEEGDDETDDETPNLSPKTTVDETPPHSPSFVPESDPEDDDLSMITARHSLSLLNASSMTVYEDCLTPGPGFSSPVIGVIANAGRMSNTRLKTGAKRQRRGMSLKKPAHETIVEQPDVERDARTEDPEDEGLGLAKTARRLDYVEDADTGDERVGAGDISGIDDLPSEISEPGEGAASDTEAMPSPSGLGGGRPSAGGAGANEKEDVAEDNGEPFLHMSEMGDFDTQATETSGALAADQASSDTEGNRQNTDLPEEAVPNKCEDVTSAQALDNKLTEAKDGSGDKISAEEPVAEGTDAASKHTVGNDEVPPLAAAEGKDELQKVLSETEEEGGDRASLVRGRKKKAAPAKKPHNKKEVAPPSSKKKAAAQPADVAPRRSSGRQNAGAKMKSILSLEKRTSASGRFRESLSQDVSESTDAREAENKAPKRTAKHGRKDSANNAASSPLVDELHKTSSPEHTSALEEGPRGEACSQKDTDTDRDIEESPSEVTSAFRQGEYSKKVASVASAMPLSGSIDDDDINVTIDTCFSEPFPSFSQVLAECRDPEKAAAEDVLKREQKEEMEEKTTESPAENEDEGVREDSAVEPNQDSEPEESPDAPQPKSTKEDTAALRSTKRKSTPDTEVPSMRRTVLRHATEDSLPAAPEVLVEDTEFQESEVPKSASSRRTQRGGPSAVEPKKRGRKPRQLDVTEETEKLEDDTEVDDTCAESEDTPSELQQAEAPQSAPSRRLRRTGQEAPPSAVRPKRAGRKAKQIEVVAETEQPEDNVEADHVQPLGGAEEDTPTELELKEEPKAATSLRSQRTIREASTSAVGPKRTKATKEPKAKQLDNVEETERLEEAEVSDTRVEGGDDDETPSDLGQSEVPETTASQGSQRRRRGTSPRAVESKRARRRAKQPEVIEETERPDDEADADAGQAETSADENTPSEVGQSEAQEFTSSQGSQRRRRGASPPAIEPKRARRKGKLLEVVEESKPSEDNTEMESVHVEGKVERPSRVRKTATPSQEEKPTSRARVPKVSRLGLKQGKQSQEQDAELLVEPAPTTAEAQSEETGSQAVGNTRGKRSTKLSSGRNSEAAADDSDFEQTESQSSRTSQRGKRGQKLSQEQTNKPLTENCLDDSALNASVESETQIGSQRRKKGVKKSQGRDYLPPDASTTEDNFEDAPALDKAAADNSLAGVSLLSGSQSPRTSQRGKKEKLSQGEGAQPPVEKDTPAQAQSTETSRRTGKGAKLSQQKDQTPSSGTAVISIPDESVAEPKAETVGASRRGRGRAKQLEFHEDLPAAESVLSGAVEDGAANAETRNVRAPRGGKKGAKGLSQEQKNKKLELENSSVNAAEECSEAPTAQSPTVSLRVVARGNRASEEKTLATSAEAASKTTQRGRRTKASSGQENQEQPQKSEPIKTSSKSKKQNVDEAETEPEVVDEPPKKLPTRCRGSKVVPAAQAPPAAKRRNARGRVNEDLPTDSAMAVEETLEETLPTCSPPKMAITKRHVASMSFGVGKRESDSEATSSEEGELEEIEMMPGPKSKRKPAAKNVVVKQEPVMEAPKRGKRKAAAAEDVTLGTPPKAKAEPVERELMSPPSAKKALKRKPKILFTGMECTNEEEIVKHLGGAIATTASMCTHLVTDKFRRTVKSLCCIGKGTPIVDIAWIKKCQEAKTFVEHMPYLLKDTKAEKSLKFVLEETLRQAASVGGVLQGWSIHATNSVLPAPADLKEIVSCAGGKYLAKMPTRATGGSTVIVSCKEDLKSCTQAKKNGVPIVSVEFVLSGLLRYKLDVGAHSLN